MIVCTECVDPSKDQGALPPPDTEASCERCGERFKAADLIRVEAKP